MVLVRFCWMRTHYSLGKGRRSAKYHETVLFCSYGSQNTNSVYSLGQLRLQIKIPTVSVLRENHRGLP